MNFLLNNDGVGDLSNELTVSIHECTVSSTMRNSFSTIPKCSPTKQDKSRLSLKETMYLQRQSTLRQNKFILFIERQFLCSEYSQNHLFLT